MAVIDRDPQEMQKFADKAKKYVTSMSDLIRGIRAVTSQYESDLDDNCRSCINKLNADCNKFMQQVNVYSDLANEIENKAKRQSELKPKFR